jgi:hypothetical protein
MKQEFRNSVGKLIGYVVSENSGELVAYDARNKKLGSFKAADNKTRDRNNKFIGFGNLLALLFSK